MAEEIPPEITLDLLIHPYYGFPYADSEHYGFQTWYRDLIPLLSEKKISASRYVSVLTKLYFDRFSTHANNQQYRVIFVEYDFPAISDLNNSLETTGSVTLGSRFKRVSLRDFPVSVPVSQIFPEVLRCSKVTIESYGEVSFMCVEAYSNSARRSLDNAGLSVNGKILPELCGDRVEGKEELLN